ncbi:MAG: thioredoxin domain-containing protein [Desulfobacterales bacterium]|nr:thioredoxin domain-containing protein [Desulfobacterales bacterium]MBF0397782.1 thioredoxin domain-containing protein [Desulfobacterales bacterium]
MITNNLINEKSPYLLQHAHNPVNWQSWRDEVFSLAKKENKPIFLSIGYATCHWCHVMEKESFEDAETAKYLNDTFICIKVDREERPDIDSVYMSVCHMLTGSGGWPLNIIMTPDKEPFFAATYIPKQNRFGRMGLIDLCLKIKELWHNDKERILESTKSINSALQTAFVFSSSNEKVDISILHKAYDEIHQSFDNTFGGFGSAPKFPTPHRIFFLNRYYKMTKNKDALDMIKKTLISMRLGGIWDHVGFGFHRYSTDKKWLLPHFEKMLYDQALLSIAYLETYQITKDEYFSQIAEEIFTYILRDMKSYNGAFFSAEDADSDGEEGKFYVWTFKELEQILDLKEFELIEKYFNIKKDGNFLDEAHGRKTYSNILYLSKPLNKNDYELFQTIRNKLFNYRNNRVHPLKDDKILTDWNGLMIAALAYASTVLNKKEYFIEAKNACSFILQNLKDKEGNLIHRFREGEATILGQVSDYAFLIWGLIELYKASFDIYYTELALDFQKKMIDKFWDKNNFGFFSTEENSELPVRPKEIYDGAIPSSNSVALSNLIYLARLTGNKEFENMANYLCTAFISTIEKNPSFYTHFLLGVDFMLAEDEGNMCNNFSCKLPPKIKEEKNE